MLAILGAADKTTCCGVLMYNCYQFDEHLPITFISQCDKPATAAVEGVPI